MSLLFYMLFVGLGSGNWVYRCSFFFFSFFLYVCVFNDWCFQEGKLHSVQQNFRFEIYSSFYQVSQQYPITQKKPK